MYDTKIHIRMSEEEKIALNKLADEEGLSLSGYVRIRLLSAAEKPDEIKKLMDIIKEGKEINIEITKAKDVEYIILRKLIGLLILNKVDTEDLFCEEEEKIIKKIAKDLRHILVQYRMNGSWS